MANLTWKILGIEAKDGLITNARYHVTAVDGNVVVETEGNWFFQEPKMETPFDQVTEEMVAKWVEDQAVQDGKPLIKTRLEEQVAALKAQTKTVAPWMPQTFTPEI